MNVFSKKLINFVRATYKKSDFIPLHAPVFNKKDKDYVVDAIDSTFVSTVGAYVKKFEDQVASYVGTRYAIATVNGTSALHAVLMASNVERNDEVITQSLTFVATCNAIKYCGANPVFVDVSRETMGMSPDSLKEFLHIYAELDDDGLCRNKETGSIIRACVPMHCLGHAMEVDTIKEICTAYNIKLIEDSAESLGSLYKGKNTGSYGESAILSFNGNKIITCGGGGMVLTNSKSIEKKVRHITTTAKDTHDWEFSHNEVGYNYRLPNINAALGFSQMQKLDDYLYNKRILAEKYKDFFLDDEHIFFVEPENSKSNYWFNAFFSKDKKERDSILAYTNKHGVMTRPFWTPMHNLPMYNLCQKTSMENTNWLYEHLVCIPSGVNL